MSRLSLAFLAAAGVASAAACASNQGFRPIAVTRDASAVSSCQKVADLEVEKVRYDDTPPEQYLERLTREKGGNTVLISSEDGRTGVAYQCSMPPATAPAAPAAPAANH